MRPVEADTAASPARSNQARSQDALAAADNVFSAVQQEIRDKRAVKLNEAKELARQATQIRDEANEAAARAKDASSPEEANEATARLTELEN